MAAQPTFTGDIPKLYDAVIGPALFEELGDELAQRVATKRPRCVLETAAGTGIVTRRLRDRLPAGSEIIATDLSPAMLATAETKFSPGEVTLSPADAIALQFPDASFDALVCQFGIMFFPDRLRGFREAWRVLAPGGHAWFSVWDFAASNPFGRIGLDVSRAAFPADPPRFYEIPFNCWQMDPIKEALMMAGFTDLRIDVLVRVSRIADIDRLARAMVFGNPLVDDVLARGADPDALATTMAEALRRELPTGELPIQAILFEARKRVAP